jgi:hypothetical protein
VHHHRRVARGGAAARAEHRRHGRAPRGDARQRVARGDGLLQRADLALQGLTLPHAVGEGDHKRGLQGLQGDVVDAAAQGHGDGLGRDEGRGDHQRDVVLAALRQHPGAVFAHDAGVAEAEVIRGPIDVVRVVRRAHPVAARAQERRDREPRRGVFFQNEDAQSVTHGGLLSPCVTRAAPPVRGGRSRRRAECKNGHAALT